MSYYERLGDSLHEEDLRRFIKKNPSTKNVKMHPDMHGPGDPRYYKKKRADAGTIDFYHYGGKKSKETKWEELTSGSLLGKKKGKEKDQARKDWEKVAKELGIGNVNSEEEVLQMIEYVRGRRSVKDPDGEPETPQAPPVFNPSDDLKQSAEEFQATRDNPVPRFSDQPGVMAGTSNPYGDAIRHGDDLNDWYTRFQKGLTAEANLAAKEIGERTRFHVSNFAGNVPELGSGMELYKNYAEKIA